MTTYTWAPAVLEGHEAWYVYINGDPYGFPFASEDEAKDFIEELKREELERDRQSTQKPRDDSGSSFTP